MRRRQFLGALGGAAVQPFPAAAARLTRANVCFITDEVDRDLRPALEFASELGIRQVELRSVDGQYCFRHDQRKLREVRALLRKHGIRVALLSTPALKCTLPGSELTPQARREVQAAQSTFPVPDERQFPQQMDFLRQAMAAAGILETDRLRIFSYWRVEDREKERGRILEGIQRAVEAAEKEKIRLCIENEQTCNLASCAETAEALERIRSPYLGMVWDVVNGAATGENPYPEGFDRLDKKRIWHMHIKDDRLDPQTGRRQICAVGDGRTRYREIFTALGQAGYTGAVSMETHFSINGSKAAASRRSMEGLLRAIDQLSASTATPGS